MMNTKDAAQKFNLDAKTISKLCKEELIPNAKKVGRYWDIPDNLKLIMTKEECIFVLQEILKSKNYGESYPINRKIFPDDEKLSLVIDYLYRIGFVGEYKQMDRIKLQSIKLTDEGCEIALCKGNQKIDISLHFSMIEIDQIGLINVKAF